MSFIRTQLLIALVGLLSTCTHQCQGQDSFVKVAGVEEDVESSDFRVTSGIRFGFSGTEYFYEFSLVDENGFAYDTWTLANNGQVVQHAGLSNAQIDEMHSIRSATKKELVANFAKGVPSSETKAEMEQVFRDAETKMRKLMDDEQLVRFDHARHQLHLQRVGLENFLASRAIRDQLGLSDKDVATLAASTSELETNSKRIKREVYQSANQEIIEQLTTKQRAKYHETIAKDQQNSYLSQRLFKRNSPNKKFREMPAPDFLRLLARSKATRDQIELTPGQLDEIKSLRSKRDATDEEIDTEKSDGEIKRILSKDQYRDLVSLTIKNEAARWGTVNALCGGTLGRSLTLSKEESQRLFEFGSKIHDSLQERLRQATLEVWKESLAGASRETQAKVMALLGEPLNLEQQ